MEYRMSEHFEKMAQETKRPENTYYWSRAPGKFVNKRTGEEAILTTKVKELVMVSEIEVPTAPGAPRTVVRVMQEKEVDKYTGPQFYGTVREWYETFTETLIDATNTLFKRHLQVPEILEVGPDILTILEHCVGYKPNYPVVEGVKPEPLPLTKGEWVGTLCNRLKIVKVPYMTPNEAKIVLITDKRFVVEKAAEPEEPVPTVEVDGLQVPSFEHDFKAPKLPKINIEMLPSAIRLDEWTVVVKDMTLL
jgi:hypothetical protein